MTYFTIILIILLIVSIYLILEFGFKIDLDIGLYALIVSAVILLLTTIGQLYYYNAYDLNVWPARDQIKLSSIFVFVFFIGISIYKGYLHLRKRKQEMSFKDIFIIVVIMFVFFIWLIPVGQKYNYVARLNKAEELFVEQPSEFVKKDRDLMIGLVASKKGISGRYQSYSSRKHYNYFYIRNNSAEPVIGDVHVKAYNKDNELLGFEKAKDVELEAKSTELLIFKEQKYDMDQWDMFSFRTRGKIISYKVEFHFDS